MKKFVFLTMICLAACTSPTGTVHVMVGGLSEGHFADTTIHTIVADRLGKLTVLFKGPWNPYILEKTLSYARENGMTVTMDEVPHRRSRGPADWYKDADSLARIVEILREYPDVVHGTLCQSEFSGVHFNWPVSSVANSNDVLPMLDSYTECEAFVHGRLGRQIAWSDSVGLPRPFISIEPAFGGMARLLRGGIDRLDVEMVFSDESERRYSSALGASKAFGKDKFGVDNAVLWYGGETQDDQWFNRFRTSLYHAWLRGADPIYAEHGVQNYSAYGKKLRADHPLVKRFREVLGGFAAWAEKHPRPEGFPQATVAFMQGRNDSFVGGWQTHIWGQRGREDYLIGPDERAWFLVDDCYKREDWSSRDKNGDINFSGNPPLGTADIIPYDTPDEVLAKYKLVIFIGFNAMDDALYARLQRYVAAGGTLLLTARHFDTADNPHDAFMPYNGGDWSALAGVKVLPGVRWMDFGVKFITNPACGWHLHQYGTVCDPWFTDGGFMMPQLENAGADTVAVGSHTFNEKAFVREECLLFEHKVGEGHVVLVPSLDAVGAPELYPYYRYLVRRAIESVEVYPRLESSDAVRWATYGDGTVVLLNTEDRLQQQVILHRDARHAKTYTLAPGEIRIVK